MIKNVLTKIISIVLIFSIFISSTFANINNDFTRLDNKIESDNYVIIDSINNWWITFFYVKKKYSSRTAWDVVDVLMAWHSWKEFFDEPSFWNLWWAVLDTAALVPLLPSSWYVRKWWKILVKPDEVKKLYKTSKWKAAIKKALKSTKVKVSDNAKWKLDFLFWLATWSKHNIDRSKSMLAILKSIWIHDTPKWREYLLEQINIQLNNPLSISKFKFIDWKIIVVRDMLLKWPWWFAKMETHWINWTTTMTTIFL